MTRTAAERMKTYRLNMKTKGCNELKAKQRKWKRNSRRTIREKISNVSNAMKNDEKSDEKSDVRKKSRDYMREYRLKKKIEKFGNKNRSERWQDHFGSVQVFGKAVKKAKAALPHDDVKKVIVLNKLLADLKIDRNDISQHKDGMDDTITSECSEIQQIVNNFFESDEISRHSPNKKDVFLNGK